MTEIAEELARRTTPDRLKELAREKREEWTAVAREKAEEKADEIKHAVRDRTVGTAREWKETAVQKTTDVGREAAGNPWLLGVLGGLLGAQFGVLAARRGRRWRDESAAERDRVRGRTTYRYEAGPYERGYPRAGERPYGSYYRSDEAPYYEGGSAYESTVATGEATTRERASEKVAAAKERAGAAAHEVRERAGEAVQGARERVEHLRERIPGGDEVRERAHTAVEKAVNEYPWALAIGAVGFGFLAAMLVPETGAERRALEPVRRKAQEEIERLGGDAERRVSETGETGATGDFARGTTSAGVMTPTTTPGGSLIETPPAGPRGPGIH